MKIFTSLAVAALVALSLQACKTAQQVRESEPTSVISYEVGRSEIANCTLKRYREAAAKRFNNGGGQAFQQQCGLRHGTRKKSRENFGLLWRQL
ncbi:MAG: hypothetical protein QF449_02445 [Alphaproteobacteria bacterium]|jgi:hypothetical protein|nr:hypothetical protein [Alphaproteobacteria bacterium]MDP6816884.1 hypothetical protein [Alphaproteobacteria bacterium]